MSGYRHKGRITLSIALDIATSDTSLDQFGDRLSDVIGSRVLSDPTIMEGVENYAIRVGNSDDPDALPGIVGSLSRMETWHERIRRQCREDGIEDEVEIAEEIHAAQMDLDYLIAQEMALNEAIVEARIEAGLAGASRPTYEDPAP